MSAKKEYILIFMLLMATISSVLGFANTSMLVEKQRTDMIFLKEHILVTERDRVVGNNLFHEVLKVGDYPDSLLANHFAFMAKYDSTRLLHGDHIMLEMTSDTTWGIVPLVIDNLH